VPVSEKVLDFPDIYSSIKKQSGRCSAKRMRSVKMFFARSRRVFTVLQSSGKAIKVALNGSVHAGRRYTLFAELLTPGVQVSTKKRT
jgi:hypothetical protein